MHTAASAYCGSRSSTLPCMVTLGNVFLILWFTVPQTDSVASGRAASTDGQTASKNHSRLARL